MASDDLFRDSPALDVLTDLARADAARAGRTMSIEDARVFAAMAMIVSLGWRLFGGAALSAAGLDGAHPERYDDRIREHLGALAVATTSLSPPRPRGTARSSG
jgi:hypothetical protein